MLFITLYHNLYIPQSITIVTIGSISGFAYARQIQRIDIQKYGQRIPTSTRASIASCSILLYGSIVAYLFINASIRSIAPIMCSQIVTTGKKYHMRQQASICTIVYLLVFIHLSNQSLSLSLGTKLAFSSIVTCQFTSFHCPIWIMYSWKSSCLFMFLLYVIYK